MVRGPRDGLPLHPNVSCKPDTVVAVSEMPTCNRYILTVVGAMRDLITTMLKSVGVFSFFGRTPEAAEQVEQHERWRSRCWYD